MKKTLLILSFSIPAFLWAPGIVHAQANPNIGNIGTRSSAPEFLQFIPIRGISGIEGKSLDQLQTAGCTEIKPEFKNGVDGGERGLRIFPSQKLFIPKENANSKITNTPLRYFACSIESSQKLLYGEVATNPIIKIFISLIIGILWVLDKISLIVLNWSGKLLITIIGQGTFIQNDLVKQAWPFVQGIANLGFIFSLLYIALATTLRLESVSSSVQRLLPRLLIGALLVNFSLIIGGLLIDASRVVMAAEIQLIGGGEVKSDTLGARLLEQTKLYENVARLLTINPVHGVPVPDQSNSWNELITAIMRSVFILAAAASMAILGFGLFERYIALLILLIISPLAYLAVTLPQTSAYAKKWWDNFIKWVLYGPILLFFLIIIIRVQDSNIAPVPNTDAILDSAFYQHIVKFIIVITLFFVSAKAAKQLGGAGSGAIVNWAQKNPRKAMLLGGAVTGGVVPLLGALAAERAGRYGGSLVRNSARDFYRDTKSNLQKRARATELFGKDTAASKIAKVIAGPERDKEGNRKPGEQDSLGSFLADKLPISTSADGKAAASAAEAIGKGLKEPDKNSKNYTAEKASYDKLAESAAKKIASSDALKPQKLLKKSTATALSKDQITTIMKHGTEEQRKALVSHKDVVKKMGDEIKADIIAGQLGTPDLQKKLDSRMRDLANKE